MKNTKKRFFWNTIVIFLATISDKFIFFFISIIIARYLTVEDYGIYTTALGYATFFSIFTNVGINESLIRSVNLESENKNLIFGQTLLIKSFLSLFIYSLIIISLFFLTYEISILYLIVIFGVVRINNEYLNTFYTLYNAEEKFFFTSIFRITFSISLFFATLYVVQIKGDYFDFAIIRLIVIFALTLLIAAITFKNYNIKFSLKNLKNRSKEILPFAKAQIYDNIFNRIGIIILPIIHGSIYAGYYNNAVIFFNTLFFIPGNFSKILLPYLYKFNLKDHKEKYQFAYDIYTKFLAILGFYIFIQLFLFADVIILTIFGENYTNTIKLLKLISFGVIPLFSIAGPLITSIDRQEVITKLQGYTLIFNIISNLLLIYFFKDIGAVLTIVLTRYITLILFNFYLFKNKIINLKKGIIIHIKLIIIAILLIQLYQIYFYNMHFIISGIIISLIFAFATLITMLDKSDIRIAKEILGKS